MATKRINGKIQRKGFHTVDFRDDENIPDMGGTKQKEVLSKLYARRFKRGECIFTGKPLTGKDADSWLLLQDGRAELSCDDDIQESTDINIA